MTPAPHHLSYIFGGYDEHVLAYGPQDTQLRILIVPPLFDEMNRTRAVLVGAMRELATRGIMTLLPDLPGCNESLAPIEQQTLAGWRDAVHACAEQRKASHMAAIRGGTLIDAAITLPRWRLAPVKGASLLKTLLRTRVAADKEAGKTSTTESLIAEASVNGWVELAGYRLGSDMLGELENSEPTDPAQTTIVQLGTGEGELWGKPVWLRAEPQEDPDMSAALAAALDLWSRA